MFGDVFPIINNHYTMIKVSESEIRTVNYKLIHSKENEYKDTHQGVFYRVHAFNDASSAKLFAELNNME